MKSEENGSRRRYLFASLIGLIFSRTRGSVYWCLGAVLTRSTKNNAKKREIDLMLLYVFVHTFVRKF